MTTPSKIRVSVPVPEDDCFYEVTVEGVVIHRVIFFPDMQSNRCWGVDFKSLPLSHQEKILNKIETL